MPTTMDDVAKQAGVSKAAVSMALNDKPGISPELKETILATAAALDYRLPERRTQKRSSEKKTITVVHCVGEEPNAKSQPFGLYVAYLQGIEAFIEENNLSLTLITGYQESDQTGLGGHLLNDQKLAAGGVILMGLGIGQNSALIRRVLQENIPAVALSRNWPHLPISTVSQDHQQQAQIALEYLITLGHRKIAFIAREADQCYDWFAWRLACYRETMTQLNGSVDESLIALESNGAGAAKTLLKHRPDVTAIFTINDVSAVSVMRGLAEIGLDIPADISVIGLDDSTGNPEKYPAPLTTVVYPHFQIGYLAADWLLKQLKNDELYYANILVRSRLVERASCAPPRQTATG